MSKKPKTIDLHGFNGLKASNAIAATKKYYACQGAAN